MAKTRLKVYRARMGFADTVIAAPNQKAALAAWGARQNLFAEGLAETTDDPAAVAAATACPGEVLQRAAGSSDPFGREAAPPPVTPGIRKGSKTQAPHRPRRPDPDRTALDAADETLEGLVKAEAEALAAIEQRRTALETEAAGLKRDFARRYKAAVERRDAARRAFRTAGGTDDGR